MMPNNEIPVLPLRDIKLPPEPGFWPLAPGWWILAGLLVLLLMWLTVKWVKYLRKKRRWQAISEQLAAIEFNFQKTKDKQLLLNEVSVFLRRFVRFQLHQTQATTLVGADWVRHLNQLQPGKPFSAFTTALEEGIYLPEFEYDPDGLLDVTRRFMQKQVMKPNSKHQEPKNV